MKREIAVKRLQLSCYKPKNAWSYQKLERQERILPFRRLKNHGPPNTLISDFWAPELWDIKFLLFWATQFMILCYSSQDWFQSVMPRRPRLIVQIWFLKTRPHDLKSTGSVSKKKKKRIIVSWADALKMVHSCSLHLGQVWYSVFLLLFCFQISNSFTLWNALQCIRERYKSKLLLFHIVIPSPNTFY